MLDVRRSRNSAKTRRKDTESKCFKAFQERKKFSYPADVRIDRQVSDVSNILRFANDFINNEKNASGKVVQKSSFQEIHSLDQPGDEPLQKPRKVSLEKGSTKCGTFYTNEADWVSPSTTSKCLEGNKANEFNDIAAKSPERHDKTVHRCNQCGKVFKTKYTLSIHLKMPDHTQSRPFVCNVCSKGFRLSSTLCRHKIIHTERKPHKCGKCGKCFNRSSTLKTHLRTHSDKKEFVCDICQKGFHQKGNLRNHIMIHTGEKPFRCNQCDRAFNKMSNLKFHMHTHSDKLPYHCRTCRKRFSKKTDLKDHVEEVHTETNKVGFQPSRVTL